MLNIIRGINSIFDGMVSILTGHNKSLSKKYRQEPIPFRDINKGTDVYWTDVYWTDNFSYRVPNSNVIWKTNVQTPDTKSQKYYVVGGEFQDCYFTTLVPGTEVELGPFEDYQTALDAWKAISQQNVDDCQFRVTITVRTKA